jgi:hypothetical protein
VFCQVLSIGGNDARILLGLNDANKIIETMEQTNFFNDFEIIVKRILEIQPKTILISVYHPLVIERVYSYPRYKIFSAIMGMPDEPVVTSLMKAASRMFKVAEKHGLPVIDLSRTFDPYDVSSALEFSSKLECCMNSS